MAVALLARRTDFTSNLAQELPDARAYACDASDPSSVANAFAAIRVEMGDPATLVYNAGSGVWGDVESISFDDFESAVACQRLRSPGGEPRGDPGHEGGGVGQHHLHRRDRVAPRRAEDRGIRPGQSGPTEP